MVCTQITIQGPGTSCQELAEDTWKPETTKVESGAYLNVTVRSSEPNKRFQIGYMDLLTWVILIDEYTDANGCYTGQIPPQKDGTYRIEICFMFLDTVCNRIHPVSVTWGTPPLDLTTAALIGAGILGLAYILGNRGKK